MLHTDNAYFIPNVAVSGTVCRTNLPSNTAMRGFGGPQGIAAIENVIEEIAALPGHRRPRSAPAQLLRRPGTRHHALRPGGDQQHAPHPDRPARRDGGLRTPSRRRSRDSNATSRTHLRGIALTPVKFGISFTRRALNQANALVNIYLDGTIQVSTGGTEMGQGLNTKIRQIVAAEFALPLEAVRVMPASTEKNNNTSPTAASASTDLNGTAALRAAEVLKGRLAEVAARHFASAADGIEPSPRTSASSDAGVHDIRRPGSRLEFRELVRLAYEERVDLGARGFYATPGVDFNRETGRGNPFLYFTNGAAVSEVVDRPADRRAHGHTRRHPDGPGPIAQPGHRPRPGDRRVRPGNGLGDHRGAAVLRNGRAAVEFAQQLQDPGRRMHARATCGSTSWTDSDNPINLLGSKAVGEPPFVLGISVGAAAKSALCEPVAGPLATPFFPGDERGAFETSSGAR